MIDELHDGRAGTVLLPGETGWSELAPLYALSGEPGVVVQPADAGEVAHAVRFAAAEGLSLTVRSGGHGAAAFPNPGGLVVDLSKMQGVEVDGTIVRIGGGALWGTVAAELGRHGLALTSGDTKSVGVGGLTLGGGIGWMVRSLGLAIDNLRAAEVVLASGEIVTASADEHPDLFWALRGGGGNFGVVTRFTFEAHRLDGVIFGHLDFDLSDLGGLLRGWRDHMRTAPEELNTTFFMMPPMGPGAEPLAQLIVCYPGRDAAAAEPLIAPLRALPGFLRDDVAPRDYADVLEDPPPAFEGDYPTIVGENAFANEFNDQTINALLAVKQELGASVLMVRYLRGAFNRVPADATAWAQRDAEVFFISAAFLPPHAPEADQQRVHDIWTAMADHTTGTYGNFSNVTGEQVVELMYPPATLERLRTVKRQYDPQNLFRRNHNVAP